MQKELVKLLKMLQQKQSKWWQSVISAEDFLQNNPASVVDNPDTSDGVDDTHTSIDMLHHAVQHVEVKGIFQRSDAENKCQEAALRLLDAAQRPSGALRERLIAKEFSVETVDTVVNRLMNLGLVDDEAYARSAVRYCVSRSLGQSGTLMELKRKGVDASLAMQAVQEAQEEGAFIESAYALVERVAKRTRGLDKNVRLRRLWSAAGRKGHSPELIRQAQYEVFNAETSKEEAE